MKLQLIAMGAVVGCAATLVTQQLISGADSDTQPDIEVVELASVSVEVVDLTEHADWEANLGYNDTTTVIGRAGTVTRVSELGTHLERGDALLDIDNEPVTVWYGSLPPYRQLSNGDVGTDVEQLEANLVGLGYDPDGTVTVDDEFTTNTQDMVERWQQDVGMTVDGVVDVDDVVVSSGPVVVLDILAAGSPATGPIVGLALADSLGVTVPVAVGESDDWALGQAVTVVTADDAEWSATVSEIGTIPTESPNGSNTIEVRVALDNSDVTDLIAGAVTVRTITDGVYGVVAVPTRSLVALAEGGFGVEKIGPDGTAALVGVSVGAFDDGLVEITSGDIVAGDKVVVPQ